MPDEIQMGGDIPPSPLVDVLRPDLNHPSGRVVLRGYPGPASDASRVRLYLGLEFTSYYELDRAKIVAFWPADLGDSIAPIFVAIEPTTRFDLVVGSIPGSAVSFLQGEIESANLTTALALNSKDLGVLASPLQKLGNAITLIKSCATLTCYHCTPHP